MKKLFGFGCLIGFSLSAMEMKTDDIFAAIEKKDYANLKSIIAKNPEIVHIKNAANSKPLSTAVFKNDIEAARILLQAGAEAEGLLLAVVKDNADMVKLLLSYGADITERDRT